MTAAHLARFKKPIIISLKKTDRVLIGFSPILTILAAVTQCY